MNQRGFGLVAQLIAGGVALALASMAFAYYNHVVSERAKLEIELSNAIKAQQEQAAVTERLRADLKRRDQILAKREKAHQQLEEERGILDAALAELQKQPEVAAWMAVPVPPSVLERVRGVAPAARNEGGAAVPAGKPAAADAQPAPAGQ